MTTRHEKKGKTAIKAEFIITGDRLAPEIVTAELGITPARFYRKGEIIERSRPGAPQPLAPFEARFNLWEVCTGYAEASDISEQLAQLHGLLKDKTGVLKRLKDEYELKFTVEVVIKVESGQTPVICLEHWLIDFLHEIRAEFGIDLYVSN